MLSVTDVRRITCQALRDRAENAISDDAKEGKEYAVLLSKSVPTWLEAELLDRGFIINRHTQSGGPDVVEIFWGAIKE